MKRSDIVKRPNIVTVELEEDGWYYTNTGYRFHGESRDGVFTRVWDLEKV